MAAQLARVLGTGPSLAPATGGYSHFPKSDSSLFINPRPAPQDGRAGTPSGGVPRGIHTTPCPIWTHRRMVRLYPSTAELSVQLRSADRHIQTKQRRSVSRINPKHQPSACQHRAAQRLWGESSGGPNCTELGALLHFVCRKDKCFQSHAKCS